MRLHTGEIIEGVYGTATEIVVDGEPAQPDWAATCATWFLHCPGQSPAWEHYQLSIIHLRPIDGVPPAHIRVAGATHEVMLVAIDPTSDPHPLDRRRRFLRPINVEEQVHLDNDDQAVTLARDCARAVVDGILWAEPPLSGQVEPWRTALIRTTAHLRGEPHAS